MIDQSLIDQIRYHHRTRNYAMEQRKRADLSLLSFLRIQLGWSRELPEKDREIIAAKAIQGVSLGEKILKARAKGKPEPEQPPEYLEWASVIEASIQARAPFDGIEKDRTKDMERLAVQLPAWEAFGKDIRGFGARSLAVIVGEAGDLSDYPKKGHLWKRMGLAVMDGVRQGGLAKNAGADAWKAHGYNRERRSRMFVIGDSLVKQGEHYRQVYLARKEYERHRATEAGLIVAPSAKIPKKRADEYISDGHIHRRAQRYMEKQLLRDLWAAWRRAEGAVSEGAEVQLPVDNYPLAAQAAE